jgi:hypothetical protein
MILVHRSFFAYAVLLAVCAPSPAFTQTRMSYGVELAFRTGHADRGYLISDRPVIQPVMWVSGNGADFSAWGNFTLAETTEGAQPKILELELAREFTSGNIAIAPAARMWFYHDPVSPYSTRSLEGWLKLSYDVGPFRVFTSNSLDVLEYPGAYFVDLGIESAHELSDRVEIGGSFGAGWANARFNESWFGAPGSGLNRASAQGWLTAYLTPHFYLYPHFEYNHTLNPAVRAVHMRPTYLLVGLSLGAEF